MSKAQAHGEARGVQSRRRRVTALHVELRGDVHVKELVRQALLGLPGYDSVALLKANEGR